MDTTNTCEQQQDLANWVSLSEAAARLPSPRTGKRTHASTVRRLAVKHGLQMLRRGAYKFVYWPDVVKLFQPVSLLRPGPPCGRTRAARRTLAQERETQQTLKEFGLA